MRTGADKTTTLRILATLLRPDGGSARVFGHDVVREAGAVRRRVALTGQFASVDEDLTARENLLLLGRLPGYSRRDARARADELLAAFGLAEAAGRQVLALSGGMRRRLDIAASLIVPPDLLFLDEPTTQLSHSGIAVTGFTLGEPSLDEVFFALTGRTAGAGALPAEAGTAGGETPR